jgi:hypothetical protein
MAAEGLRACGASYVDVALTVQDSVLGSNVWIRLYVKPVPYDITEDLPAPGTNDVAGFFVTSTGSLMVLDGEGYVVQTTTDPVPTNQWLGFVVHADYATEEWDLYMTANPFGAPLSLVNGFALSFYTGATHRSTLRQLVIQSTPTGYVDAVAVAAGDTLLQSDDNVMAFDLPTDKAFMMPPPPYQYSAPDNELSGQMGTDLAKGLSNDDKVRFLTTNGWESAYLDAGSWQDDTVNATDRAINHGQNFWVDRRGTNSNSAVFYPYGTPPTNVAQTIYGTNEPAKKGWNNLVWPINLGARGQFEGNGWHFDSAANNDKLWIYENNAYTVLKYSSSSNHWSKVGSRTATDRKLIPGGSFWYQRRVGSDYEWDPID